jgi:hypothetical protein
VHRCNSTALSNPDEASVLSLGVEPRSDALQAPAVTTLANSARRNSTRSFRFSHMFETTVAGRFLLSVHF